MRLPLPKDTKKLLLAVGFVVLTLLLVLGICLTPAARWIAKKGWLVAGVAAGGTVLFADVYSLRKRQRLRSTSTNIEELSQQLREKTGELQAEANRQAMAPSNVRRRARRLLSEHSLRHVFRIYVATSGERIELNLTKREAAGRLSTWLFSHQVVSVGGFLLAVLHSRFHFHGFISILTLVLFGLVVANGLIGTYLYYFAPKLLLKFEERIPSATVEEKFNRTVQVWLGTHVGLSGALTGLLVVHVLSVIYY